MIPGMGMNPRQMARMMEQMGIKNEDIEAVRVVIETKDEQIIIAEPKVTALIVQGQKSYQVVGNEERLPKVKQEDIELVAQQTGSSADDAKKALSEAGGDIAAAILRLKKE